MKRKNRFFQMMTLALIGTIGFNQVCAIELISVSSDGVAANGSSSTSNISADGRYVVFQSVAANLAAGDTDSFYDIYLRDTQTGQTSLISTNSEGLKGNGHSDYPAISADGRYVVFESEATNLAAGDADGAYDIYLKDTQTGQTILLSASSTGVKGNHESNWPAISADGRYVVFASWATNLAAGDTDTLYDIYLKDVQTGDTTLVSTSSEGVKGNSDSFVPAISADGRYVAFGSDATNLAAGDESSPDIYLKDIETGQTVLVSASSTGEKGNFASDDAAVSADGRYVVFSSWATNLAVGDTDIYSDVFLKDAETGQTTLISTSSAGMKGNSPSYGAAVSADGRYVVFASEAINLVAEDLDTARDIYLKDTRTGQTALVSTGSAGLGGNGDSDFPAISADGRYVVFFSSATNLVDGDTNGKDDVFRAVNSLYDPDTDLDGLPDSWEMYYGLNPADSSDATSDLDSDGLTALQEYQARTDPNNNDTDGDGAVDGADRYPTDSTRFRNTVVQDLNPGDGFNCGDVILRNGATGAWRLFSMDNAASYGNSYLAAWDPHQSFQAAADFDGDGDADVLLRDESTGRWWLFEVEGGLIVGNSITAIWPSLDREFQAAADFDGDGDADVLVRDMTSGGYRIFFFEKGVLVSSASPGLYRNLGLRFVAAGDLDGDGDADVLVRHATAGSWRVFFMENGTVSGTQSFGAVSDLKWTFQGLEFYDKDQDADLLLRHSDTGAWQVFEVESGQVVGNSSVNAWSNLLWQTQSAQLDFNGDGVADLLLRNTDTGAWRIFTMNNLNATASGNPLIWSNLDWVHQ